MIHNLSAGGKDVVATDCVYQMPYSYTYTLLYLSAEDLERCFGIQFTYDENSDCYIFQGTVG